MDSLADTKWFYAVGTDRKGPFSKEQISALLSAGVLDEHSKVWSESVSEWMPLFRTDLRTLLGTREISPPEIAAAEPEPAHSAIQPASPLPAQAALSISYPVYRNRTLGTCLYWALCALAFAEAVAIGMIVKRTSAPPAQKVEWLRFLESDQAAIIWGIPIAITGIIFLTWKYRATANAFNAAGPLSITPWGAVYWYFVPVAFLWKPFEAMRNLHDAFIGGQEHRHLHQWWALWLASFAVPILELAIYGYVTIDTTNDPGAYIAWTIGRHVASGLAFYFAAILVKEISEAEAGRMGTA